MPAWGDIVNSLLLNRQKLQEGQLNMADKALDIINKQQMIGVQNNLREAFMNPGANVVAGAVPDPASDFASSFDMGDPLLESYRSIKRSVDSNQRMADLFREKGGGSAYAIKQAEEYDKMVREGQTNLRESLNKIYDARQTKLKEAGQVLQGVRDQGDLVSALDYLQRNFSPGIVRQVVSGIPFDPNTGLPIFGLEAAQAIKNAGDQATTANEKMVGDQKVIDERGRDQRAQQQHQDRVNHEGQANYRAGLAQSGANARAMLTFTGKDDKLATAAENAANNDLNKNELVKNFPKYAQVYSAAQNVDRQMRNGSLRDTAAPDIRDMMSGYQQMINNFRTFMGGRWTEEQNRQMQGALQNVRTYFETVGQGRKPDQAVVRDVAAEVARVYQNTNAQVLKQTLQLRERAAKKGGDPNSVVTPAQMSEVIRTRRADIINDPQTGQQYMAFRDPSDYGKTGKIKDPTPENVVPIYNAPVQQAQRARLEKGRIVFEAPVPEEE